MIAAALAAPVLPAGMAQPDVEAAGLLQRRAEDGIVDWTLPAAVVAAHVRALSRPYPGLAAPVEGGAVILSEALPFDDDRTLAPGEIGRVFIDGSFLADTGDGRLLTSDWATPVSGWQPVAGLLLDGRPWGAVLAEIVARHRAKYPDLPVSPRLLTQLDD